MRMVIAVLLSATAISSSAGELKDTVDRFKGSRVVAWEAFRDFDKPFTLSTYAYYASPNDKEPYGYYSALAVSPGNKVNADCNNVDWLIDGVPDNTLRVTSPNNGDSRSYMFIVGREELKKLSGAKLIELRVCNVEGKIDKDDIDGIGKVLTKTE